MQARINDDGGGFVTVEAGPESIAADGEVRLFAPATEPTVQHEQPVAVLSYTPAEARDLAAALLRAADEAEGVPHMPDVMKQFMADYPGASPTGRLR